MKQLWKARFKPVVCALLAAACLLQALALPALAAGAQDETPLPELPAPDARYFREGDGLWLLPLYAVGEGDERVEYAGVLDFFSPIGEAASYSEDRRSVQVIYGGEALLFNSRTGSVQQFDPGQAPNALQQGALDDAFPALAEDCVIAFADPLTGQPWVFAPLELLLAISGMKAIPYAEGAAHPAPVSDPLMEWIVKADDAPWGGISWEQLEYIQSFSAVLLTSQYLTMDWDLAPETVEQAIDYLYGHSYPVTGYAVAELWAAAARQCLSDFWDCQNRADVLDTLDWLLAQGHRYDFWNSAAFMPGWFVEKWGDTYPAHALLGWDLARAIAVAQWACCSGYLTQQEALGYELAAARAMQQAFDGWEAFFNDYMMGYDYWGGQDQHLTEEGQRREQIYQTLFAGGTFRDVAWNQPLPGQSDQFAPREEAALVPDWWFSSPVDENGYVSFGPIGYHAYYGGVTAPGSAQPDVSQSFAASQRVQDTLFLLVWFAFPLLAFVIAWAFSRRSRLKPIVPKPAPDPETPPPAFAPSTYAYYPERPGAKEPDRPVPPKDHYRRNRGLVLSALFCGVVGLYLPLYGVLPGTAAILLALPVCRKGRDHYGKAAAAIVLGICIWVQLFLYFAVVAA